MYVYDKALTLRLMVTQFFVARSTTNFDNVPIMLLLYKVHVRTLLPELICIVEKVPLASCSLTFDLETYCTLSM